MESTHAGNAMRNVVVLVQDGAEPFGLGSMCEVWAEPYHPEDDNPVFDFKVATTRPGRVRGASGFDLHVEHGLDVVAGADLVCVCPKRDYLEPSPEVAAAVRAAHDRGATVFAHCTGAFVLGEAGLLDGRRCTTHWRHADRLAERFPRAQVDGDVLYVHDGSVITGAGSAAGLDAALHLLRETFGAATAASAARRMVVPPHRDGGQAQFIARAVPDCDAETLGPLLTWIVANLGSDLDVETLARRALMSPRTFARRFRAETGATPHAWVTRQRVLRAEQLLEETDRPVEWIAGEVGFGNAATLRHHFTRVRGVSPQRYRRQFAVPAPA
ncbi:helix-turn-helix domain-containing protein [Nocardioides sp. NPDC092400]|uniref:GlxA family transcriptional regulator n=1 Tax=Nocardioides sp. NPDC092400 TaxID=3155196 RepID=UPI003439D4E2